MAVIRRLTRWSIIVLILSLAAACGGGGGGDSSPPAAPPTPPSKVFVGDSGNAAIGSSPNSNPSPGVAVVERTIIGSNTMLSSSLKDFAIDAANDRLYVSDLRSILVFDNVSTASGNVAPSRVLSSFPGFGNFTGIYLDTVNNRLYASVNGTTGFTTMEVRVFENAGSAIQAAPSRTVTFTSNFLFDVAVDTTRNILYAYHKDSSTPFSQIAVFDGADGLSGPVTPNRIIAIGDSFSSGPPVGMFMDSANDRLYAPRFGQVMVFDNASTKDGSVDTPTGAPTRTVNLPVFDMSTITVELMENRLYAADSFGLNIIDNASTVTGSPPIVTRVIAPGGSVFKAVAVKP